MTEQALSPAPSRFATRSMIWLYTLITVVLAPLLNFGIALAINLDLASFTLYMFIPIGTFALCALACSGFFLGASRIIYHPDMIDLVFLMIASAGSIVLGFVFEYVYLMVAYDATPAQLGTFGRFVFTSITEAEVTTYSRHFEAAPPARIGDVGVLIMVVRVAGAAAIAKAVHSTMVSRAINMS